MSWHFAMFQFSNTSLYTHIPNSYFLQISIKRFNFWPETSHKIIKNVTFIKLTNTISIMQSTMTYHTFLINKNHMHYKHFSVHKNKVFAFLKDSNDHWVVSLSAGFFGLGLVLDVEVVGVGRFDVVLRREIGVRVIESGLEMAPDLWRGVLVEEGGAVLGVLNLASLCVLGTGATADLFGVGVRGVGVLGERFAELWDRGDMSLGRGLGEDLAFPDLLRSDLLFERGVLEVRPREALPKVPGPLFPALVMLPLLLLLLRTLPLLLLLLRVLLGLLRTGLSNSVLPEEQSDPWDPDLFFRPRAWHE